MSRRNEVFVFEDVRDVSHSIELIVEDHDMVSNDFMVVPIYLLAIYCDYWNRAK